MKVILFFFLNLSILSFIYSYLDDFDYYYFSTKVLSKYSKKITGVSGKSNQTKCYANTDIKINDTLFTYDKKDILSSETCYHPKKEELLKNITSITNDTYDQNKLLLSFCVYYIVSDPDKNITNISRHEKFHILSLPIDEVKHSELLFDYPDLNEFLIGGSSYKIFEPEMIEKIVDKNLNIFDKKNENFRLFSKIYYYISTHSFNISGNVIILPFLDICNVAPYYLHKNNINLTNSSIIEEQENKIIIKSKIDILQSDQYSFAYNIPLDNDYLMLKQGAFSHNNIYDKYTIKKKFSYEHNYETDELYHALKRHNLHPSLFNYRRENHGYDGWYKFELLANKTSDLLYRFGIIYFNWWKTHSRDKDKDNSFRHIAKQSMTLILRMCYDELQEIKGKMEVNFDEYLFKTQEDKNLTDLNKKLRHFTMEKVHLIHKNIEYLYNNLGLLNFNEIKQNKEKYVVNETNKEL